MTTHFHPSQRSYCFQIGGLGLSRKVHQHHQWCYQHLGWEWVIEEVVGLVGFCLSRCLKSKAVVFFFVMSMSTCVFARSSRFKMSFPIRCRLSTSCRVWNDWLLHGHRWADWQAEMIVAYYVIHDRYEWILYGYWSGYVARIRHARGNDNVVLFPVR